ncbi:MAG: DMT family transporter [Bacteroides sp.]|nr:DMT family transporter [Bacteroides sp.]
MKSFAPVLFHILAIITVTIWGTTFVSTKILIGYGLTPVEIFFYRFLLAYGCIWLLSPRKLFSGSPKDEVLFLAAGLCGGSLYFIAENTALGITLASNVSLILATTPLMTAFLSYFLNKKEKLTKNLIYGSCVALAGVALVVFNGSFILQINPLGDILTLISALVWSLYCILLKKLENRYPTIFITRKVFAYGLITLIPFLVATPLHPTREILQQPTVIANLLFLGLIASMLCFMMWNTAIKNIGVVKTSNYIYIVPLVTLITSSLIIDEKITLPAITGCIMILGGVYLAEKRR